MYLFCVPFGISIKDEELYHSSVYGLPRLHRCLRDRPFNLKGGYGFLFRSKKIFRTIQELEYLIFFQILTLGYMTKTLNQTIFFFPPPKSEYFFQQHWESEFFFRKKTITPSLRVKWSFP